MRVLSERQEVLQQRIEDMNRKFDTAMDSFSNYDFWLKQLVKETWKGKRDGVSRSGSASPISGSASPRSGYATPRSPSQTSLHKMREEIEKRENGLHSRANWGNIGDEISDKEEHDSSEDEQETIRGRHGDLTITMHPPHHYKHDNSSQAHQLPDRQNSTSHNTSSPEYTISYKNKSNKTRRNSGSSSLGGRRSREKGSFSNKTNNYSKKKINNNITQKLKTSSKEIYEGSHLESDNVDVAEKRSKSFNEKGTSI